MKVLATLQRVSNVLYTQQRPYSRQWLAALTLLLLGTGVTAFGVPTLLPDLADFPVRQVAESPLEANWPIQTASPFVLYQTDLTRRDDTVQGLLSRLGVNDQEAQNFLSQDPEARHLLRGEMGKIISVEHENGNHLLRLTARWLGQDKSSGMKLVVERTAEGFSSKLTQAAIQRVMAFGSGVVRSSLFAATDAAAIPDGVSAQMAETFSKEVDFRHGLKRGARFSVVYDVLQMDGETLHPGRLLGAELINGDRTHRVMWYQGKDGQSDYFGLDGQSRSHAFLASPVPYSRVTSSYGMRSHPVLGGRRAHLGTDYGAPHGTPVRSVADGMVVFSGWRGGYGNYVIVRHDKRSETAYAHLSRISVRKGQKVTQGQLLGQVGATGTATGPNLHFEYVVGGVRQDPAALVRRSTRAAVRSLPPDAEFKVAAADMRRKLEHAALVVQASAQ